MNKEMITWNKSIVIFSILLLIVIMYALTAVLTPLLISAILAYLANPLVNKLVRLRIPRLVSVIIIFSMLFFIIGIILLILIPLIQRQINDLINFIPAMMDTVHSTITNVMQYMSDIDISYETLKQAITNNIFKANMVAAWIGKNILASGFAIIEWAINLILIPVVTFYLLRDWNVLLKNMQDLLPRAAEPTITRLAKECDEVLGQFLRGQFLVMIALGIFYAVGLTLIGLKVGVLIGLIAGLVSIVPYLGFIVGLVSSLLAAWVQFGTLSSMVLVLLLFLVGQMVEGMILTPLLVGNRVGLHPVAVIFAILAGGSLFGFFGILLAVPVASVIMVLLRFISHRYHKSEFYKTA